MPRPSRHHFQGPAGALPLRDDDPAAADLAMLVEGETSGRPLDEVLASFGRSRSSYYEKLQRFREAGVAGLLPRRPGPRGPWRVTLEVASHIVGARLRDPRRPADAIAADLRRQGYTIGVRSVERTLARFGLTRGGGGGP